VTEVVFDASTSFDESATASGVRPEKPMGHGQRLHERAQVSGARGHEVPVEMRNTVVATSP
jgi:hypothetical protein